MEQAKKKIIHKVRPAQVSRYSEFIQRRPGRACAGGCADEALTGTKDDRPEF